MNLHTPLRRSSLNAAVALLILIYGCATPPAIGPRPSEYVVAERIKTGGCGGWDLIAFDHFRQSLFISRADRVQVWSAQSKQLVGEISGTAGVLGVALAQELGLGFTSDGRANTVTVDGSNVDRTRARTRSIVPRISVPLRVTRLTAQEHRRERPLSLSL